MKNNTYLWVLLFAPFTVKGQNTVRTQVLWAGYQGSIVFNKKWSVTTDVQIRTKEWAGQWLLYNIRSGINLKLNENTSLTAGLAIFRASQNEYNQKFFKNDWRIWQQYQFQHSLKQTKLFHRLRLEERFLQQVADHKKTNQYQFMLRLRYRIEWQLPLVKNKWIAMLGDELMINPAYINQSLFFDQNRSYAGFQYCIQKNSSLQIQFYKIFQWQSKTSIMENQDVIRLNFIQQLQLNNHPKNK